MAYNRRRRGSREAEPEGNWLTTYSDMVTLILCFFVLLFALSNVDRQKFESFIQSFQISIGVLEGGRSVIADDVLLNSHGILEELMGTPSPATNIHAMYEELVRFIESEGLADTVNVSMEEPGIVVRFPDQVLFDLGEANLKPEFEATLNRFADALSVWEGEIRVEGHSDSLPIHRPNFPSNWELSAARASRVVRFFIDRGLNPNKLSVAGFGEHRPIYENSTPEGRARNRRVDVVLLADSVDMQSVRKVTDDLSLSPDHRDS